jgi:hypothetical protein
MREKILRIQKRTASMGTDGKPYTTDISLILK